jgi:hypothetical protein
MLMNNLQLCLQIMDAEGTVVDTKDKIFAHKKLALQEYKIM